jgi:adenylate cyclase class 2
MKYEVEQKFHVENLSAIEEALRELGAGIGGPVSQSDRYLSHPGRDFARTDEALRLRSDGESNFITYKGPRIDQTTKTRRELELALPDGQEFTTQLAELLTLLGFGVVADVRKRRRSAKVDWQGSTIEVVLDEVEGLGTFVELETCTDEAGVEAARQQIGSLAERLGLKRNERRSYCELILEQKGRRAEARDETAP